MLFNINDFVILNLIELKKKLSLRYFKVWDIEVINIIRNYFDIYLVFEVWECENLLECN